MIVRITRNPLTAEQIEQLEAKGQLRDDYADRSAPAKDFVNVDDGLDDCDAIAAAREKTRLTIDAGETIEYHRVHGPSHVELLCE